MRRLDARLLGPLLAKHLAAAGVEKPSVDDVVASLIQTSLRGTDSHGIQLYPHYVRATRAGRINAAPRMTTQVTGPATALVDADHAFGHHAGAFAMDEAVKLAAEAGAGVVSVKSSTHFGAAAYFALRAAERGCLGFAFTNADSLVKAFNARTAFFGTNPICFTAPLEREGPLCLDMATSQVAWNKLKARLADGLSIPGDWAFDEHGEPTEDPALARSLNPSGGYKGFGLGMMVEVLCALLSGGPAATELLAMYGAPIEAKRSISHFFMAIDLRRFVEPEVFKQRLQYLVDSLRSLPAKSEPVMAPGDPEKRMFVERSVSGIPVSPALLASLLEVSEEFGTAVMP